MKKDIEINCSTLYLAIIVARDLCLDEIKNGLRRRKDLFDGGHSADTLKVNRVTISMRIDMYRRFCKLLGELGSGIEVKFTHNNKRSK